MIETVNEIKAASKPAKKTRGVAWGLEFLLRTAIISKDSHKFVIKFNFLSLFSVSYSYIFLELHCFGDRFDSKNSLHNTGATKNKNDSKFLFFFFFLKQFFFYLSKNFSTNSRTNPEIELVITALSNKNTNHCSWTSISSYPWIIWTQIFYRLPTIFIWISKIVCSIQSNRFINNKNFIRSALQWIYTCKSLLTSAEKHSEVG